MLEKLFLVLPKVKGQHGLLLLCDGEQAEVGLLHCCSPVPERTAPGEQHFGPTRTAGSLPWSPNTATPAGTGGAGTAGSCVGHHTSPSFAISLNFFQVYPP